MGTSVKKINFKVGDEVFHPKFGIGKIEEINTLYPIVVKFLHVKKFFTMDGREINIETYSTLIKS